MDVPCQGGEEGHILHVRLPVEHGLVEMSNAPPLGNVERKPGGEGFGRGLGGGVSPGAEGCQQASVLVKGQITVHHGRNAQRSHLGEGFPVLFPVVPFQVAVGILNTCPHILQMIGPVSAFKAVFPVMGAAGQDGTVRGGQYRLDTGGAKLNAQGRGFLFKLVHTVTACLLSAVFRMPLR